MYPPCQDNTHRASWSWCAEKAQHSAQSRFARAGLRGRFCTFVIAVYASFEQFADFSRELLYEQVLEGPSGCCVIRHAIEVELPQPVGLAKEA
jgi:hypothetical protein